MEFSSSGAGVDARLGQHLPQTADEFIAEGHFGLVCTPEHGDAFTDARGVMVGESRFFALEPGAHAGLHGLGVDERIVDDEEKLFRDLDGNLAHGLRPVLELVEVDAEHTVDHEVGGNGNMGTFVRH